MPDGRAVAFVGQDEDGVWGIFVQDFDPGRDTAPTRRRLTAFDTETAAESFAISPDGTRLTVASWDRTFSVMLAEGLTDVAPPRRAR
jgi:Tol biopolymer transport system component